MIQVNREAMVFVRELMEKEEIYSINTETLPGGSTLLDLGVLAKGSISAGILLTKIMMGGLGDVSLGVFPYTIGSISYPALHLVVNHPLLGLGCQISGWELSPGEYAPILAGPGRTLRRYPDDYLEPYTSYQDDWHEAVITIEAPEFISQEEVERLVEACNVLPENLYILQASSSSIATAVQVAGRIGEQGLHRLMEEGYPIETIVDVSGFCLIPPMVKDELLAMGRLNDALIYGGQVNLVVEGEDGPIEEVIEKVTAISSPAYGRPFKEIYRDAGCDFYQVPREVYSPAVMVIMNRTSGRVFQAGRFHLELLAQSFQEGVKP